jgi:GT2 family glycosyltransferase
MLPDVIAVSFNSGPDVARCIASILENGGNPLVVDNGSTDETLQIIAAGFPEVRVLHNPLNGYARAANLGLRNTTSKIALVCNADVTFPSGAIRALTEFLERRPKIGVLGAQQVYPDGSWQRSWGLATGVTEVLVEACGFTSLRNGLRKVLWPRQLNCRAIEVGYIDGAMMAIRRAAFDSVGGFDERFPFSSEDTDFCMRVRQRGWRVSVLPTVSVIHRRGGSTDRLNWTAEAKIATFLRGTNMLLAKRHGALFRKFYFQCKRLSNFNMAVLCQMISWIAPARFREELKRKEQVHRIYVDQLGSLRFGDSFPLAS